MEKGLHPEAVTAAARVVLLHIWGLWLWCLLPSPAPEHGTVPSSVPSPLSTVLGQAVSARATQSSPS